MSNFRGEKILFRREITDSGSNPVIFADISDVRVEAIDPTGKKIVKTKSLGTVVEGTTVSEVEFELTEEDTLELGTGSIDLRFSFTVNANEFSGGLAIDILEELNVITLQ